MKRSDTVHIGNLIAEYVREQGLAEGLLAINVYRALYAAVGADCAKLLSDKSYRNKCLCCTVKSSVVRSILYGRRAEIIRTVNETIGWNAVEKLILR